MFPSDYIALPEYLPEFGVSGALPHQVADDQELLQSGKLSSLQKLFRNILNRKLFSISFLCCCEDRGLCFFLLYLWVFMQRKVTVDASCIAQWVNIKNIIRSCSKIFA